MKNSTIIKKYEYYVLMMINILEVIVLQICNCIHFETNDDEWISDITSGILGFQEYRIRYLNTIYLKIVVMLDKICSGKNWHGILMTATVLVSFNCIIYVVHRLKKKIQNCYLITMILLHIAVIPFYLKLQFTRTSAMGIIAGLTVITYSYGNEIKKNRFSGYLVGTVLVVWASLIRFDNVYAVGLIFAPSLLVYLYDSLKKKDYFRILELCIVGICCLGLVFGCRIYNRNIYKYGDYKVWDDFDISRSELMDFGWPEYVDYEEFYASENISENSFMNYILWDLEDPDYINVESMKRIIEQKGYSVIGFNGENPKLLRATIPYFTSVVIPKFTTYTIFWIFIGTIIIILFWGYRSGFIIWSSVGAFTILQIVLSYMQRGGNERVDAGLFMALITVLLLNGDISQDRIRSLRLKRTSYGGVALLIIISLCLIIKGQINEFRREEALKAKQGIIRLSCEDKDNIYLTPELDRVPLSFSPFEAFPVGYSSNYLTYGGWITGSPLKTYQKRINNITNMYRDIVDREDVYLVLMDQNIDLKLDYYREHYGNDINAILVRRISGVHMYKIVHGNEINIPNSDLFIENNILKCEYEIITDDNGSPMIIGSAMLEGENSYTQKVYLGIIDESGNIGYHSTIQIVKDENAEINEGKYSSFIFENREGLLDNINYGDIVILYDNGNLKLKNSMKNV